MLEHDVQGDYKCLYDVEGVECEHFKPNLIHSVVDSDSYLSLIKELRGRINQ